MLESQGHAVREACDGVQGLKAYREEAAQVVVLDMFMPEKDGLETLRELRQIDPEVRVLAISGGGARQNVQILQPAVRMGAAKALLKPFKLDDLLTALRDLLPAQSQLANAIAG
jgi:CheY-like chemotaxis protein